MCCCCFWLIRRGPSRTLSLFTGSVKGFLWLRGLSCLLQSLDGEDTSHVSIVVSDTVGLAGPDCCIVSPSSFCSLECAQSRLMQLIVPFSPCESTESISHSLFRTSTWSEGQSPRDFQCCVLHKKTKGVCVPAQCVLGPRTNAVHLCLQELPNALACTSSWPGAMPWCKRGSLQPTGVGQKVRGQ